VGEDGSSHQALEDIALMRIIPNMKVIVPCDAPQTRDAVMAAKNHPGPFYIRLGRPKIPTIEGKEEFKLGKAQVLRKGKDITLIACGLMVKFVLDASDVLAKKGIKAGVINLHTIKPFDYDTVIKAATQTHRIVVCEEHSITAGLACCVDEVVTENCPVKVARVGVKNKFGQSGNSKELLEQYGLTSEEIVKAAESLLS